MGIAAFEHFFDLSANALAGDFGSEGGLNRGGGVSWCE